MKVLWFSITPARYGSYASNGGGWIESLQRVVAQSDEVKLGIAFVNPVEPEHSKIEQDGVTYYPIYIKRGWLEGWCDKYSAKNLNPLILEKCKQVIADFHPDVIHVFGSEWCFGLLKEVTLVPLVIHMQGSWPAYYDKDVSLLRNRAYFYLKSLVRPRRLLNYFLNRHLLKERVGMEERILTMNNQYMGRTHWDYAMVRLYSPKASYWYCSEALRDSFVLGEDKWEHNKNRKKKIFVSTGLAVSIKGYDTILKTAKLLKEHAPFDFEWRLLGPKSSNLSFFEHLTHIKCKDVNVVACGNQSADKVKDELMNADCYIHLSYIDNSPNAVCEAQYLGLPVIAANTGGVRSLFADDYDKNLLVPSNEPHFTAMQIIDLLTDEEKINQCSESNFLLARNRHNDEHILKDLLFVYNQLMKNNGSKTESL